MGKLPRVAVCGCKKVGKTALLHQIAYGVDITADKYVPTIDDTIVMQVEHDKNAKDSVLVLDTCGLDAETREIKSCYLQCADALIFVYGIDSQASFDILLDNKPIIERTLKERKDFLLAILGNKVDNESARVVAKDAALTKWKEDVVANRDRIKIYEVTAKSRDSLLEPFTFILSRLFPSQKESKFLLPRRKDKQPGAAIVIDI